MNEDLLKEIYNQLDFKKDGLAFDQFKKEMELPELQKEVYDELKLESEGLSYDQFQTELGGEKPETPAQQPSPEQSPQETEIDLEFVMIPTFTGSFNLGFLKGTRFGDFVEDTLRAGVRGWYQGASVGESVEILRKAGESTNEDLTDYVDAVQKQQKYGVSDEYREFVEAEGFKNSAKVFAKNPITIVTEAIVESAAAMARSGGPLIAGAASTGPAAVVTAPLAMGATSAALETSGKLTEGIQEYLSENGLEFDQENIQKVFEDADAWAEIRNKAIGKGAVVGLVDAASAGIVTKIGGSGLLSKMTKAVKKGKKATPKKLNIATTAKQAGVEMAGGGVGEAASQLAIGEEIDPKGTFLEIITETPGAAQSIGSSFIVNLQRWGKLTDEQMAQAVQDNSREDFNATVDVAQQLGQIDEGQAQGLKESFEELSSINETIPGTVSDRRKRSKIVGLIKERKFIEKDLQDVRSEETDPALQEEQREEIEDLEADIEEVNSEIKTVKDAEETGTLREEGVQEEGVKERVGDMQRESETQTEEQGEIQQQTEEAPITPSQGEELTSTVEETQLPEERVFTTSQGRQVNVVPTSNEALGPNIVVDNETLALWNELDAEQRNAEEGVKSNEQLPEDRKTSRLKGIAQEYAARKRKLLGTLTDKERASKAEKVQQGDRTVVDDVTYEVTGSPSFGKYPVKNVDTGETAKLGRQDPIIQQIMDEKKQPPQGVSERIVGEDVQADIDTMFPEPVPAETQDLAEDVPSPEEGIAEPTADQKLSKLERGMADEAMKLTGALNRAVNLVLAGRKGGNFNRTANSIDRNKFVQAIDEIAGDNPKRLAAALVSAVSGSTRLPRVLKRAIEPLLGEPLTDFIARVKEMQYQRGELTRQAAAERQARRIEREQNAPSTSSKEIQEAQAKTGEKADPKYKEDVGIMDSEMDAHGYVGLKSADINKIREWVELPEVEAGYKAFYSVVNEARKYMSTGRENFVREAEVVSEVLNGAPVFDLDAKMIAIRRAIDHMENVIRDARAVREVLSDPLAIREQDERINRIIEDLHHFTLAYNKIGTMAGRILAFRKEQLKSDFYSISHLRDLMIQAKGLDEAGKPRKLTSTEENFIQRKSDEMLALKEEIDQLYKDLTVNSGSALENLARRATITLKRNIRKRKKKKILTVAEAAAKLRNTLENGPC